MDKILIILGITTFIFMAVCFVFIWYGKTIPDSFIYSYFGLIGAEGTIMGWIKNTNEKKGIKDNENN